MGRLCAVSPDPHGSSQPSPANPELRAWRAEVGRFRAAQPRRRFPLHVQIGTPLGFRVETEVPWPMPPEYDEGLRFDVVDVLVAGWLSQSVGDTSGGYLWLTRPGTPELHDVDLLWHAAATRAFPVHEVDLLGVLALTRTGWIDVRSGERRVWKRLRL